MTGFKNMRMPMEDEEGGEAKQEGSLLNQGSSAVVGGPGGGQVRMS